MFNEKQRSIYETVNELVFDVDLKYIESEEYYKKFRGISGKEEVDSILCDYARRILKERNRTCYETLVLLDLDTGEEIRTIHSPKEYEIVYSEDDERIIRDAVDNKTRIIALHNHPTGYPPTANDAVSSLMRKYTIGIVCGHNGLLYAYLPSEREYSLEDCDIIHEIIDIELKADNGKKNQITIYKKTLQKFGIKIWERR